MIWARFQDGGSAKYGIVEDDKVTVVNGNPITGEYTVTGRKRAVSGLRLLPPSVPSNFFACGLNYKAHILHAAALGNPVAKVPERPEIGYRANNALIGHGDTIVMPADLPDSLEAEPEVVAVIGRSVRHASREEAATAIFGWTLGNDVSARVWQRSDRTFWRAKNSDTFKPMGPFIITGTDPMDATTTMRVNGAIVSSFATGDMIFDAIDYIVEISKYITIQAGDVIWMGADGTAPIAPGDTVEIDVSGIGTLRNNVVREPALKTQSEGPRLSATPAAKSTPVANIKETFERERV